MPQLPSANGIPKALHIPGKAVTPRNKNPKWPFSLATWKASAVSSGQSNCPAESAKPFRT